VPKVSDGTVKKSIAAMAERFKLKVDWDTRDRQTYDLVEVKAGRLRSTSGVPSAEA